MSEDDIISAVISFGWMGIPKKFFWFEFMSTQICWVFVVGGGCVHHQLGRWPPDGYLDR